MIPYIKGSGVSMFQVSHSKARSVHQGLEVKMRGQ